MPHVLCLVVIGRDFVLVTMIPIVPKEAHVLVDSAAQVKLTKKDNAVWARHESPDFVLVQRIQIALEIAATQVVEPVLLPVIHARLAMEIAGLSRA